VEAKQLEAVQVTAGVDWATLTMRRDKAWSEIWCQRAYACLCAIGGGQERLTPANLMGYIGVRSEGCFVGSREDGYIAILASHHANEHWGTLVYPGVHVARLDVQCTVRLSETVSTIARDSYSGANDANSRLPVARRRKLYIITGSDGGDTLYVGAPSSNQRGRLYNKAVQSMEDEYKDCWRWEVMLRDELAHSCAESVPADPGARALWAVQFVRHWWRARGVSLPPIDIDEVDLKPLQRTKATDDESTLNWLRSQVAPAITRLTQRGYGETIRTIVADAIAAGDPGTAISAAYDGADA